MVKEKIEREVLRVPAKVGVDAPVDVFIPPGPTNIDVGKVQVFQKLNVATKAVRNMLEIQKEIHVLKKGTILKEDMININTDDLLNTFQAHVRTLTALSLGANLPNALSAPHFIANAFKNVLAIGAGANISFKELDEARNASAKAPAQAAPAQGAPAKGGAAPAKAPEPEPVEENVSMGGLFDRAKARSTTRTSQCNTQLWEFFD